MSSEPRYCTVDLSRQFTNRCLTCGAPTIKDCPHCGEPIGPRIIFRCHRCDEPLPWTLAAVCW